MKFEREGIKADGLRMMGVTKIYQPGFVENGCSRKGKGMIRALNDVYLEVSDGELLSILGHNGAGKTTMINILTGMLNQS